VSEYGRSSHSTAIHVVVFHPKKGESIPTFTMRRWWVQVQFVPREAQSALLPPQIDFGPQVDDDLALAVEAWGTRDGQPVKGKWRMLDPRQADTGFSAMERCTAIPAAVVRWTQATGQVAPGGRALEIAVAPGPFLKLLGPRDLPLSWEIEPLGRGEAPRPPG
jgi:saccharopine dehydrogenase-like NADP-dependent oxidoreductase